MVIFIFSSIKIKIPETINIDIASVALIIIGTTHPESPFGLFTHWITEITNHRMIAIICARSIGVGILLNFFKKRLNNGLIHHKLTTCI